MDIKLPPLGEGADSGVVIRLPVKPGDTLKPGQLILELENEKAVAPIPSPVAGRITQVYVQEGDLLTSGQPILAVETMEAEPLSATPAPMPVPVVPARLAPEPAPAPRSEAPASVPPAAPSPARAGLTPPASPSLRKMARDLGIDLGRISGSEYGGRIVMADLRAYIQRLQQLEAAALAPPGSATAAAPTVDFAQWGPITRQSLSPLRQTIRRRMTENWTTIPHVTQFAEADLTGLLALSQQHAAAYAARGARLTVTIFLLKALVLTLRRHPVFNSSLEEATDTLVLKNYYHLGLAVDTEAGLIVPVLRDVDQKDGITLALEVQTLAERARQRQVTADELKGGTFTLSNQGGIGGAHFTPIINKPEVAILGAGQGALKPAVRDGRIEIRTLIPLGLSYDHRVIDGAAAARFITDLVSVLEQFPAGLLHKV